MNSHLENPFYQHYQSIIPAVEDNSEAWFSKLPKTFWVNTLRISLEAFALLAKQEALAIERVAWHKGVYRVLGDFNPTKHWIYAAGLIQMQEEAAMHCAYLLDLKPTSLALDMCAAPGNKSAQMALLMQNKGTLIVNDMNFGRMRAFGQISKRLGLMNVSSAIYNAANLPRMPDCFDAIMVDVPCSCEGTFRKKWPKPQHPVSAENSKAQAKRQLAILNKAIQLAKPGAKLVYSTCTFSPYENEGVITQALQKWGDQIELLPIQIPHFKTAAGVLEWQEHLFDEQCQLAARIWPHQNNTGGFFMALIRKKGAMKNALLTTEILQPMQAEKFDLTDLQKRFEFQENAFSNVGFHQPTKKGWYVHPQPTILPNNLRLDASGLFFYKTAINFPKLSTAAAMVFGKYATKNIVHLTAEQRDFFLTKQDLVLDKSAISLVTATGYVLVFYQNFCLGVGLYFAPTEQNAAHRIQSMIDLKLVN